MVVLAAVGEKHDSKRILETAYDLATAYDDDLRVLHVIPREDAESHFERLKEIPEFREYTFYAETERAEDVSRELADAALGDYDRDRVIADGRIGDPAQKILDVASTLDPRYVVVGGRKRSPAGKALFGSVSQSVILNAEVPVVTVIGER